MTYETFEEMLQSFLGREIESIEFSDDDNAVYIGLSDGSEIELGKDEEGDLYMARNEFMGAN